MVQQLRVSGGSRRARWIGAAAAVALGVHALPVAAVETPVLVLNSASAPPFATDAGDGFLDIVIGEAFRRAGLRYKIVRLSAERGLKNANDGIEDGEFARIGGMEKMYPNLVPVPGKVVDYHFVAFSRDPKLNNATWDTLAPLSVGLLRGWKIYERSLKPGTQMTAVDTPEQLFSILDKNRIDVALYERSLGLALIKKMGIKDVHVVEPALTELAMYTYLHKKHADKVPKIAAALQELKTEGFYKKHCLDIFTPLSIPTEQCSTK
jgi:polar amino acid transport system substrate-binding protein